MLSLPAFYVLESVATPPVGHALVAVEALSWVSGLGFVIGLWTYRKWSFIAGIVMIGLWVVRLFAARTLTSSSLLSTALGLIFVATLFRRYYREMA